MPEPDYAHPPFSDRELERYLVGELDAAACARIEEAAARDPDLRAHLEERRASQRAFAQLHPAPRFLDPPSGRPSWRWPFVLAPVAALALVVAVVEVGDDQPVRARGASAGQVQVVVKRGERLFPLGTPPPLLRRGDALRVDLVDIDPGIIIIGLVAGGRGQVLLSANTAGGQWSQPSSLVLDDATGSETLVVLVAKDAVEAERARAEVAAGVIPAGAEIRTWEKEPLP